MVAQCPLASRVSMSRSCVHCNLIIFATVLRVLLTYDSCKWSINLNNWLREHKLKSSNSSSSSQQKLRNVKHLLTICWAVRSFLQPPPLPVNHFVNDSPIWLQIENEGNTLAVGLISLDLSLPQGLWYLKRRVFRQRKRTNCVWCPHVSCSRVDF